VLRGAWLMPGAFIAAIGAPRPSWRELDDDAMRHLLLADSRHSAEPEAGDVIDSGATVSAEIGEILAGTVPPPRQGTTVIFKALGEAWATGRAAGRASPAPDLPSTSRSWARASPAPRSPAD
jgi:thiomorpholine-carboxylate dehydrogenase